MNPKKRRKKRAPPQHREFLKANERQEDEIVERRIKKIIHSEKCLEQSVEYLTLLASRLPDSLPPYLFLDSTLFAHCHITTIQLLNPDRFDRFTLAVKGLQFPFKALGWEKPMPFGYCGRTAVELPAMDSPRIGICIPPMECYFYSQYHGLEEGFKFLQKHSIPFKIIAENQLTSQWDGLDYLFYSPTGLTREGKRKLQGFCAAGDTVISSGELLGFSYEMSLKDWKS